MISAKDINFSYGRNKILKKVELAAHHKKFVGIIGPNGSGKSTLLKCFYRTLEPDTGIIYLGDDKLHTLAIHESAKKMSVVAQHNHSSFDFIVEDFVLMGRSPYKKLMERYNKKDYDLVHQALRDVDMLDYKARSFTSLSGGEQQRIVLARALAQEPQCLILDEPTNHLDIKHQLMLLNIVRQMDISVIAAVHDLNIALNYCDYIYVLKAGEVAYHGCPDQVIHPEMIKEVFGVQAKIIRGDEESAIVYKEVIQ